MSQPVPFNELTKILRGRTILRAYPDDQGYEDKRLVIHFTNGPSIYLKSDGRFYPECSWLETPEVFQYDEGQDTNWGEDEDD